MFNDDDDDDDDDDVNITEFKSHDEEPRDQRQFWTWTPILLIDEPIYMEI